MLADHLRVSRSIVHRVWQCHDVQPHRVERFKLSNDPEFEAKVRDIVGLYLNPPDRALVLCVDEKSQIQALDRNCTASSFASGTAGEADARLQAEWHDDSIRRIQYPQWQSDWHMPEISIAATRIRQIPESSGKEHCRRPTGCI